MTADAPMHVVLVDLEASFAAATASFLEPNHTVVTTTTSDAIALARRIDCIVLDLDRDAANLARCRTEHPHVPILLLTEPRDERLRVLGLEAGADGCLVRPCSLRELLARIRALVRRTHPRPHAHVLRLGALVLDRLQRTATVAHRALALTDHELALLWALALHPGRALSRAQLLRLARSSTGEVAERSIDVHMCRIRGKLAACHGAPRIGSIRGSGYILLDTA